MKLKKVLLPLFIIILMIAVFAIGFRIASRKSKTDQKIQTVTVKKGTVKSSFSATGIIASTNQVDLDFNNSGELDDLKVVLGDKVEEDQKLAVLKYKTVKTQTIQSGQGQAGRPGQSAPSTQSVQKTVTDYETLRSPIDGTVIHIGAKEGEDVIPGSGTTGGAQSTSNTIATSGFISIADLDNLEVRLDIDQADIPKVKSGQKVTISLDAIPNKLFTGEETAVDPIPVNDQNVITYIAHASIDNPSYKIRLGMSANVNLDLGTKKDVLVVPNLCVRTVNGHKVVTKVVKGNPVDVRVEIGASDDMNTEIVSGLKEGDKVTLGLISLQGNSQSSGGPFGH